MQWNWQQPDWPNFTFDPTAIKEAEAVFLQESGIIIGTFRHIQDDEQDQLKIELISTEAYKTSEIEGEILDRNSLQSSIRRHLGLVTDARRASPAEEGISELMVHLYHTFQEPLTHQTLFAWHEMLTNGRRDLHDIGCYRTHDEPMQVVSGSLTNPNIHFEAPPSSQMADEMDHFLKWFNTSHHLPALTRAGIAHLHFISIHPFEDGNGRIGRALAEKVLAQSIGQPTLIGLSTRLEAQRKDYYDALAATNKHNIITPWLTYFAEEVLQAQKITEARIEFLIEKTKLFDRLRGQLNERQQKVLERMFCEGPDGFTGGLSTKNYLTITTTSRATATRDLTDLVNRGALTKTGQLKSTRYWLNVPMYESDKR